MAKIYAGQDFRLKLATSTDISTAACVIKFITPHATAGSWVAAVATATFATVMWYDVQASVTSSQDGFWTVWGRAVFSDGTIGIGEPQRLTVYVEGII
jgi:hypothetical protein